MRQVVHDDVDLRTEQGRELGDAVVVRPVATADEQVRSSSQSMSPPSAVAGASRDLDHAHARRPQIGTERIGLAPAAWLPGAQQHHAAIGHQDGVVGVDRVGVAGDRRRPDHDLRAGSFEPARNAACSSAARAGWGPHASRGLPMRLHRLRLGHERRPTAANRQRSGSASVDDATVNVCAGAVVAAVFAALAVLGAAAAVEVAVVTLIIAAAAIVVIVAILAATAAVIVVVVPAASLPPPSP